jgi:hypothetical protein
LEGKVVAHSSISVVETNMTSQPMAFLSKDGLEDLRQRLDQAGPSKFSGFCDPLQTEEYGLKTIAELFAGQVSTHSVTRTALVAELLLPLPLWHPVQEWGVEEPGDVLTQMRKRA